MVGFLFDLLTLPVLGGPRLVHWLGATLAEEADREVLDEGPIRGELLELQQRYDSGELEEDEYNRQEEVILQHLQALRDLKA